MSNTLLDVLEIFRNDITAIGDRPMTPEKIDFIITKLKQPTSAVESAVNIQVPQPVYAQSRLSF